MIMFHYDDIEDFYWLADDGWSRDDEIVEVVNDKGYPCCEWQRNGLALAVLFDTTVDEYWQWIYLNLK